MSSAQIRARNNNVLALASSVLASLAVADVSTIFWLALAIITPLSRFKCRAFCSAIISFFCVRGDFYADDDRKKKKYRLFCIVCHVESKPNQKMFHCVSSCLIVLYWWGTKKSPNLQEES